MSITPQGLPEETLTSRIAAIVQEASEEGSINELFGAAARAMVNTSFNGQITPQEEQLGVNVILGSVQIATSQIKFERRKSEAASSARTFFRAVTGK